MFLLLMNEYFNYKAYNTTTLMYVDKNRGSDNLTVRIDIDFNNLPCELVAIEIRNNLGLNSFTVEGDLNKYVLDSKHQIIGQKPYAIQNLGTFGHNHQHVAQPDYEFVKKQVKNKEGCKLKGSFTLDAVPGAFIISSMAFGPVLERLRREGLDKDINIEHTINELSFGEKIKRHKLLGFGRESNKLLNTLHNKKREKEKAPMVYQYYLKIVPTKYVYYSGNTYNLYHYTANSFAEMSPDRKPLLFFKYDLSPITVEYKHTKMSFLTFIINVFAILGGVFTVAGIIDSIIHKSVLILLRKAEMNKIA